jgi:hypothetical protein
LNDAEMLRSKTGLRGVGTRKTDLSSAGPALGIYVLFVEGIGRLIIPHMFLKDFLQVENVMSYPLWARKGVALTIPAFRAAVDVMMAGERGFCANLRR